MAQLDLSNIKWPDKMDLRTASIFLELSDMRVRTLAREETLPSTKDEEGNWVFALADLKAYKSTPHPRKGGGGGGPRGEGKTWKIKVKFEDVEKVKAALAPFGIVLQPAYDAAKMKEGNIRRKAAKAAATAKSTAGYQQAKQASSPTKK
jgi:hypothetical protein